MQKTFVFSCLALIALLFTSFGVCAENEEDSEEEVAIRSCIENNLKAIQDEDIDAYWETCRPPATIKEQTKVVLLFLFKNFDLSYTLDSYNLISKDDKKASVEVKITIKKISGHENFKNNVTTQLHTLKKIDGKWYIVESTVKDVSYLN